MSRTFCRGGLHIVWEILQETVGKWWVKLRLEIVPSNARSSKVDLRNGWDHRFVLVDERSWWQPFVTKHYKLVPARRRWRPTAGKVTVGLASHLPCVTDSVADPSTDSSPQYGRWTPRIGSFAACAPKLWNSLPPSLRDPTLTLTLFCSRLKTHHFGLA